MTLEDIDRAIGEYEKALEDIVCIINASTGMLFCEGRGVAAGQIQLLINDLEALNYMREKLAQPEGEQE